MPGERFQWYNPLDWLDAPREFVTGMAKGVIEGDPFWEVMKEGGRAVSGGMSFREGVQEPLVRTGRVRAGTSVLGTEGRGSGTANLLGTVGLDPLFLVPAVGQAQGLTKIGKLASAVNRVGGTAKRLKWDGFSPQAFLSTKAATEIPEEIAKAAGPKFVNRIRKLEQQRNRYLEKGPVAVLGKDGAERVAAGQQRFLGFTGEKGSKLRGATVGKAREGAEALAKMPIAGAPLRVAMEAFDKTLSPIRTAAKALNYRNRIESRHEMDQLRRMTGAMNKELRGKPRAYHDDIRDVISATFVLGRDVGDLKKGTTVRVAKEGLDVPTVNNQIDDFIEAIVAGKADATLDVVAMNRPPTMPHRKMPWDMTFAEFQQFGHGYAPPRVYQQIAKGEGPEAAEVVFKINGKGYWTVDTHFDDATDVITLNIGGDNARAVGELASERGLLFHQTNKPVQRWIKGPIDEVSKLIDDLEYSPNPASKADLAKIAKKDRQYWGAFKTEFSKKGKKDPFVDKVTRGGQQVRITPEDINPLRTQNGSDPAFRNMTHVVQNEFASRHAKEAAVGLARTEIPGYWPVALTPKATRLIQNKIIKLGSDNPRLGTEVNNYLKFARERKLTDEWSVDDLNEMYANLGGHEIYKEIFKDGGFLRDLQRADPKAFSELARRNKLFVGDVPNAVLHRGTASIKAVGAQKLINNFTDDFAIKIPYVDKHGKTTYKNHVLLGNKRKITEMLDKDEYANHMLFVPSNEYFRVYQQEVALLNTQQRKLIEEMGFAEITAENLKTLPAVTKNIKGYIVPREAAEEITKNYQAIRNPKALGEAMQLVATASNTWKAFTLLASPAYHARNLISDGWLAYMGGLRNPRFIFEAIKLQLASGKGQKNFDFQKAGIVAAMEKMGLPKEEMVAIRSWMAEGQDPLNYMIKGGGGVPLGHADDLRGQVGRFGVTESGWEGEMTDIMAEHGGLFRGVDLTNKRAVAARMGRIFTLNSPILRAGAATSRGFSNTWRIALYLQKIDDGMDGWRAGQHVLKHLYDYRDVSQADRKLRSIFPFWMWTKNNVPHMLELMWTKPEEFLKLARAKTALESGAGPDKEAARQDWIKRNYGVAYRTNKKTGKVEFLFLRNWLPAADIVELAHPLEKLVNDVHPWMKLPFESVMNQSFFTQKPISRFEGQEGQIGTPFGTLPVPGVGPVDGRMVEHWIKNVVPYRAYRDLVEGLSGAMPGYGPGEFRAERGGLGQRVLSYAAGVKTTGVDPEVARQRKWNTAQRERGRAVSTAKQLRARGDIRGAERAERLAEKRIKKIMAEINR